MRKHALVKFDQFLRNLSNKRSSFVCFRKQYCVSSNNEASNSRDPGPLFIQPKVQDILKSVTGVNLDVVFAEKPTVGLHPPKYRLLTNKQLKEVEEEAFSRAEEKLQMPPVMADRDASEVVLSDDTEIDGHDSHPIVFTDITYGLPDRERAVCVREASGRLRLANPSERDRVLQVYFPHAGRMVNMPQMFEEEHLEHVLSEHRYLYVLDRACVQFEPDDPHYNRVTRRTYEHIAANNRFNELRFTRHFGGMAFYFAFFKNLDGLMLDMLHNDRLSDAVDMVTLFNHLHPGSKCAQASSPSLSHPQLVKTYIEHESKKTGQLELALQAFEEASRAASSS